MSSKTNIVRISFIIILNLIVTFSFSRLWWTWNFDDAYIVYRIVHNIIQSGSWAYNIGESHNPSTSVLNPLLISFVTIFNGNIPNAAHIIGFFSIFLAGTLLFLILSKNQMSTLAAIASIVFIQILAENCTWGVETNLFIVSILMFVYFEEKPFIAWTLLGFITLIRPDGVILAILYSLKGIVKKEHNFLKASLLYFFILLPWITFSLFQFGKIFPDTLSNKMWQGASGLWGEGWIYLQELVSRYYMSSGYTHKAILLLSIPATQLLIRNKHPLLYIGIFAIVQQSIYVFLNVPMYHWYPIVLDVYFYLSTIYLTMELVKNMNNWWPTSRKTREIGDNGSVYSLLHPAIFFVLPLIVVVLFVKTNWNREQRDDRDAAYTEAIHRILHETGEQEDLAVLEVGTVGFYWPGRIIDLTGLVSANSEYISGVNIEKFFENPPKYIFLHNPEWSFENAVKSDFRFVRWYKKRLEIQSVNFPMILYERESVKIDSEKKLR